MRLLHPYRLIRTLPQGKVYSHYSEQKQWMVQTHKVRKDDVLALLQSSMTYQVGEYQIRFRGEYENQNYYQVNLIPYKTNSNLELLLKF